MGIGYEKIHSNNYIQRYHDHTLAGWHSNYLQMVVEPYGKMKKIIQNMRERGDLGFAAVILSAMAIYAIWIMIYIKYVMP